MQSKGLFSTNKMKIAKPVPARQEKNPEDFHGQQTRCAFKEETEETPMI